MLTDGTEEADPTNRSPDRSEAPRAWTCGEGSGGSGQRGRAGDQAPHCDDVRRYSAAGGTPSEPLLGQEAAAAGRQQAPASAPEHPEGPDGQAEEGGELMTLLHAASLNVGPGWRPHLAPPPSIMQRSKSAEPSTTWMLEGEQHLPGQLFFSPPARWVRPATQKRNGCA